MDYKIMLKLHIEGKEEEIEIALKRIRHALPVSEPKIYNSHKEYGVKLYFMHCSPDLKHTLLDTLNRAHEEIANLRRSREELLAEVNRLQARIAANELEF